jgi:hypothetical protein
MNMDIKQTIIGRLRATKRENIEAVVNYMSRSGFFTRHCHHHHHYAGGLAEHAWQTYQVALSMNEERKAKQPNTEVMSEDSIAIAALLHDFCDCAGMRDITGHGRRSAGMLKRLGLKLTQEEFLAVRFHMSLRNKVGHPRYDDALSCRLRELIHKADGVSAKLRMGHAYPLREVDELQDEHDDVAELFVSALDILNTTLYDPETKKTMSRDEVLNFLRSNTKK